MQRETQKDERLLTVPEDMVRWLERADQELEAKGPRRVALDTEADSLHSYKEKLSLIQLRAGERSILIDPLEITDLNPLIRFLDTTEVWLHGMDYDLSLFRNTFNWLPADAKDTQLAAQLAGHRRFGLANLLDEVFEVKMSKESQRADWGKRPLSEEMIEYALGDVLHLLELADVLLAKLEANDRAGWFLQNCNAVRRNVIARKPKDPDELWRIKGFGRLSRRGWGYLRELWLWREGEAEKMDRPAYKVLPNGKLLFLVERLMDGKSGDLRGRYSEQQKATFADAAERASKIKDEDLPKKRRLGGKRKPDDLDERVLEIRRPRDRVAKELDLEPSLIATRGAMEDMVMTPDEGWAALLPWQRDLLRNAIDQS